LSSPATDVDSAILSRMSVRAYLPQPVEREKIAHILQVASRAPSGTNTQPWRVYVLQGASLKALTDKVCAAHDAIRADPAVSAQYKEEYDYYPSNWTEPYIGRRRENGWGLYGLLGIERGQKDRMHEQHQCNFRFFDAPVGLVFTIDDDLEQGLVHLLRHAGEPAARGALNAQRGQGIGGACRSRRAGGRPARDLQHQRRHWWRRGGRSGAQVSCEAARKPTARAGLYHNSSACVARHHRIRQRHLRRQHARCQAACEAQHAA
jgi:nitroreductase